MSRKIKGEFNSPDFNYLKSRLYKDFNLFFDFFNQKRWQFIIDIVHLALIEDGEDLTSKGIFQQDDTTSAYIIAKQDALCSSLPLIDIILLCLSDGNKVIYHKKDGDRVLKGEKIAVISGPATDILKAERVILNFLSHLFGISTYTNLFIQKLKGSTTKLLDTRKTLPGLRYLEKYAVSIGGGQNHRMDLSEMLMVKDNHIDRAGSIKNAVLSLRHKYNKFCPPIIVECRNIDEVKEAVQLKVHRILLDNMNPKQIQECVKIIPPHIEIEISGGINLDNIENFAHLGANYISVGAITKDAPSVDLSMSIL
ncbi:carboxylating nicotinate-nucleotide diphosphorylase [Desulfothermus okinawensis JCM 13304]